MSTLSGETGAAIDQIAARRGFSPGATRTMLDALRRGGGRMAQFDHPEFSGHGQWMRGGMTMVSDMFNHRLKDAVDALCNDLSNLLEDRPGSFRSEAARDAPAPASSFRSSSTGGDWPSEFGAPSSSGSQNGMRYAVFGSAGRLAIEHDGRVTVHDTLDHRIGGVSQQQGASGSLRFTSQHGPVDLAALPVVSVVQAA